MPTTNNTQATTPDSTSTKRTRTTTTALSTNPFSVTGFKWTYRRKDTEGDELVNTRTGELGTFTPTLSTLVLMDSNRYAKFFLRGIDTVLRSNLSSSAFKLLLYIMKNLSPTKDEIVINLEDCLKACKWKSPGAFSGPARELIQWGFIAKSTKGSKVYWINTDYIFNGYRKNLYKKGMSDE